ncbi:MAG TPA: NAD(P)-dependent oxidoreductase [Nocardiopsis listeri]|uniref:NAD(P)-dependent oxidoreductase n=1 Tax=Nocardiopsis listeri TaxID=53440 RepID=UPI001E0C5C2E|nr:NAD(P)-dependent oxidoreductase [Nocardiopsis listeri]HJE61672.1 NAD(P)-dependent oxidoreductase [Nocardiopsis listeri]
MTRETSGSDTTGPVREVAFVGLGRMGAPMARLLSEAGYRVRGFDASGPTDIPGVGNAATAAEAATGADVIILMLPDSTVVESVLREAGVLDALAPGTVLLDMGSSEPGRTRVLGPEVAGRDAAMVDAPVSGGVRGARAGTLTIMVGGDDGSVARVRPLLEVLGRQVRHVGPAGAGHALKAINNLLSATHLLVTSEALLAGAEFGLDTEVMLEAINTSSGRSGSTERKWPDFVVGRGFDSGFGLRLMLKDMRIATGLAASTGHRSELGEEAVRLWARAAEELPADADHTEIVRWLEQREDDTNGSTDTAHPGREQDEK